MSVQQTPIYFAHSETHGMGVFAARDIAPGDIIEICPVLLFPKEQLQMVDKTILYDYYFDWDDKHELYAICLGYGSLYNHSYQPNAEYDMDFGALTIDFSCIKPIKAGEEVLVNYNGYPSDRSRVWFDKAQ